MKITFLKPNANKPPRIRKTTGLNVPETTSLISLTFKNGTTIMGISAVTELGIALVNHKQTIISVILKTIFEL